MSGRDEGLLSERERVLGLFDLYFGRVLKAKGKNWRAEFERFRAEVEAGHQQIDFEVVDQTLN